MIWGRFSSDQQRDSDSRERQERLNRELAKRKGVKVLAEYFDEGVSVKDGATPLFRKVIAELPEGVGIITENLDRINRGHPWRAKAYIADILDAGHFVITSQDGREYTAESIGELDTLVIGDISANLAYAENSKRIKRVREAKDQAIALARKGIPAPLGAWLPAHVRYDFDTRQYVINEQAKATTKRIFEEYASGKGMLTISRALNADNLPTFGSKKAGAWIPSAIQHLLRCERVIGTLTINGERIPKAYPPAISEALYYRVQDMLSKNVNRRGNRNAEKVRSVFRGLCTCAICGNGVKVYKGSYLGCSGYRDKKKDDNGKVCSVKNLVRFDEMEREFLQWFVPHAKHALIGKDSTIPRIDALEGKRKAVEQRIEMTMALMDAETPLPMEQIKSRLTKLEVEKRTLEGTIAEARAEASSKAVLPETMQKLEAMLDAATNGNHEVRRKLADLMPSIIKNVVVDLQYRDTPSFQVQLTDPKAPLLEWLYKFVEYSQPIIGIAKSGNLILGKGKAIDGHYEQTK